MSFYNLVPDAIREIQPVDEGQRLLRNGGNLASVFSQLPVKTKERVIDYLGAIVPGIKSVKGKTIAGRETLEFKQTTGDAEKTQTFLASNMSDGTLRALGVLVAVLQGHSNAPDTLPLVGIEEPEIALHPAASGILFDILREASEDHQVIVTSHSPDLLDNDQIDDNNLLSVALVDGATVIAPIDEASRTVLRDKLYTPGELPQGQSTFPRSNLCGSAVEDATILLRPMNITISTIVEGQGEVRALPILLRRLGELYCPEHLQKKVQ